MATIKIIENPERSQWSALMRRAVADTSELRHTVSGIIGEVCSRGDDALRDFAARFDHAQLASLRVSEAEMAEAESAVSAELKDAIALAERNIAAFHSAQAMRPITVETAQGVVCSQRAVPIGSVGLYIPGGNSPLFSTVLMLDVHERIAG